MTAFHLMAVLTFLVSAGLWLAAAALVAGPRRRLLWVVLLALPLSTLVNLAVKGPLLQLAREVPGWSGQLADLLTAPLWLLVALQFLAPVTEEAIKLAPLALPGLRRRLSGWADVFPVALFLGLGFGLGEILFLGWRLTGQPIATGYPWYHYAGFLSERLVATVRHGIMTAVALRGWGRGWSLLGSYLGAVVLHALGNVGALLYQTGLASPTVVGCWFIVTTLLLFGVYYLLHTSAARSDTTRPVRTVFVRSRVPDPAAEEPADPLQAIPENLGHPTG